jgi:hypothetical protein
MVIQFCTAIEKIGVIHLINTKTKRGGYEYSSHLRSPLGFLKMRGKGRNVEHLDFTSQQSCSHCFSSALGLTQN